MILTSKAQSTLKNAGHGSSHPFSSINHLHTNTCNRYKKNGQGLSGNIVTGLWPGSTLHCIEALRSPRWEDYIYEYLPEENGALVNQMAWLGNGWGVKQMVEKPSIEALAFYITPLFQERDVGIPQAPRPEENRQYDLRPWSY